MSHLTYSPVVDITSIRMLITLTNMYGLKIHQMNVKTYFLNRDLDKKNLHEIAKKRNEAMSAC